MTVTTEHLNDELLQRHFDGDLDRDAADAARAHLAACEPCEARRRGLERLHMLLGTANDEAQQEADFAGLYDRIERGITTTNASATDPGAGEVVELATRRRPRPVVAYVLTAAAAAAAVVIMVFRPGSNDGARRPESVTGTDAQPQATAPQAAPGPGRSEVVNVDFGTSTGTVFEISLADGTSTPVVWINDE
ncbi:MAG TPA: hypothetical protein VF331_10355 [Polyangiales bacterium]